ncbi:MAG: hypothetical protein H6R01_268 [Burkholderiaceae bacterium]|nr:hypothetical protein [Burkholderiaceae bacterium]
MISSLDADAVAQYLADNPEFFRDHAELLAKIRLSSQLGGRTVSLQDRQMEVMRDKHRTLELRLAELVLLAKENDAIVQKYKAWTRTLLLARNDVDLPHALITGLQTTFGVPHASLRLWRVAENFTHTWFAQDVGEDARLFANSLSSPYCGANRDFEAVRWLEAAEIQSVAMLPLRNDDSPDVFGLLIMGSPDPERFTSSMAIDFLIDIGETASAALTCLLD